MVVFSLCHPDTPGFQVDLFANEPFDFSEAYARAVQTPLDNTEATVISLQDLIFLKRQAGRTQDLADIDALIELERGQR